MLDGGLERAGKILSNERLEFMLVFLLVSAYLTWFCWPGIWNASENKRLVEAFSDDEAFFLDLIKKAVKDNTFDIDFYGYGQLYFYITLAPLLAANQFTNVTEQHIIVALRLVSFLSGIATALAVFLLSRRFFSRTTAWLATFLLLTVPRNFLDWSDTAHPDMLQLFLITAGIYFMCRLTKEKKDGFIILSSAFAALAFATKYAGAILLPIIWATTSAQTKARRHIAGALCKIALSGLTFILVSFLMLFYPLTDPDSGGAGFFGGIMYEIEEAQAGEFGAAGSPSWLDVMISPYLVDELIMLLALLSLVIFSWRVIRRGWARILSPEGIIWLWITAYYSVLILFINWKIPRILLPITPFIIILASSSLSRIIDFLLKNLDKWIAISLTIILLATVFHVEKPRFDAVIEHHEYMEERAKESGSFKVGGWLVQQYPPDTRILYDARSYVPPYFTAVSRTYEGSLELLKKVNPDVVVIDLERAEIFHDLNNSGNFTEGESEFIKIFDYYKSLQEGSVNYTLVKEFEGIRVYEHS